MQHPDEGTIHAWLDGALGSDDARALEAHVAGCAACAAAVTEARGLLAASSRILSALDAVPGGVLPAGPPMGETGRDRVATIAPRVTSRWRSPGLRAAAAIVLVGSVSWLATRSAQKDRSTDTRSDASVAATMPERATAPVAAQAAPAPDQGAVRDRAPVVAAKTAAPLRKPTPAAAPSAEAGARTSSAPDGATMLGSAGAAGAGAGAGVTAGAAKIASTAPAAAPAPPNVAADAASRVAARAPASAAVGSIGGTLSERRAAAPQAMLQGTVRVARENAAQLVELPFADADAQRLAGCYLIATTWSRGEDTIADLVALLPGAIELSAALDSSAGDGERVLRPAAGAPPFAAGARATWSMIGPAVVRISSRVADRSLSAILTVRGDSLAGEAVITSPAEGGTTGATVRGTRTSCAKR